jgi:lipid A ethanolaminephosphotransferase
MKKKEAATKVKTGSNRAWHVHVPGFILAIALANAVLYQGPLYGFAVSNLDTSTLNGLLTLATLFLLVAFVTVVLLALISMISHRLLKPVCMLIALCNAAALYFLQAYRVVLDKTMMGNLFNTNAAEAGSFLDVKMVGYLLLFGLLPCWLLTRVRIEPTRRLRRLLFLVLVLLSGSGWFYANAKTWLWIDKNASRLGGMILPWSYVFNTSRYYNDQRMASREQTPLPAATAMSDRKTIVFLVIGESARAKDFSLYGYPRNTNPRLAQAGVAALPNVQACATYTTAALLCILSHVDTSRQFITLYEPLPSYLARQGVDVIWRTNNWGEPPLKVQTYQRAEELRRDCQGDACGYDEVLLHGLEQRLRASTHNKIFVVLHQAGSHGPSYYTKYPKQFEVFRPVCKSVDLQQCSNEELVNAYDNTIVYTDYFIDRAISLLKTFPETATMLMYVSDHGESLGEYGLYLHGTPYSVAPDVQKNIPFLVWMSDAFKRDKALGTAQIVRRTAYSEAYVFHSIMGAFDMQGEIYKPELDLFSGESR